MIWCSSLTSEGGDGPDQSAELLRRFAEVAKVLPTSLRLKVVPSKPGGVQAEVKPVAGQTLADFLEQKCREDNGIYQLRALFDAPSDDGFVQVRVAFPGTAADQAASSGAVPLPMIIEQFECGSMSNVAALKRQIQERTKFPHGRCVLLVGIRRLQDELHMHRVASAVESVEAAGNLLQCHLSAGGAYAFLRREGQGHRKHSGSCTMTLMLPLCVQGSRERPMPFELSQQLGDLRWCIQSLAGVPPAGMKLTLLTPIERSFGEEDTATLESLGFADACTLRVERDVTQSSIASDIYDMPLDTPTAGSASMLYECAGAKLGIADTSRLALFAGNVGISRSADLSSAPIADGVVLSAYTAWPLQLSVSVLSRESVPGVPDLLPFEASMEPGETVDNAVARPAVTSRCGEQDAIACLSCDTVAEVRGRLVSAMATAMREDSSPPPGFQLRGSKVFAVDRASWLARGSEAKSLSALANLLGHFKPVSESARLSRLGVADGSGHLIFVPEELLLVEVVVHVGDAVLTRKLPAVPGTVRLVELAQLLAQSLREKPAKEFTISESKTISCKWSLMSSVPTPPGSSTACLSPQTSRSIVAAVVAKGKRVSFGGESSAEKRPRLEASKELPDGEFIGDLHAKYPVEQSQLPTHFMCPITYDVMCDPVVVVGSGNTYDRKSIEKHFSSRHSDPLTNMDLRRTADRRLVPNNSLRSQIDEAVRSQVHLRLAAHLNVSRNSCTGDAPMEKYLGWCTSLLRGRTGDVSS